MLRYILAFTKIHCSWCIGTKSKGCKFLALALQGVLQAFYVCYAIKVAQLYLSDSCRLLTTLLRAHWISNSFEWGFNHEEVQPIMIPFRSNVTQSWSNTFVVMVELWLLFFMHSTGFEHECVQESQCSSYWYMLVSFLVGNAYILLLRSIRRSMVTSTTQ